MEQFPDSESIKPSTAEKVEDGGMNLTESERVLHVRNEMQIELAMRDLAMENPTEEDIVRQMLANSEKFGEIFDTDPSLIDVYEKDPRRAVNEMHDRILAQRAESNMEVA